MEKKKSHLRLVKSDKEDNIIQLQPKEQKVLKQELPIKEEEPIFDGTIDLDYFELMVQSDITLQGSLLMVTADAEEVDGLYAAINKLGKENTFNLFLTFLDVEMTTLITNIINTEKFPDDEQLMEFVQHTTSKILNMITKYGADNDQ